MEGTGVRFEHLDWMSSHFEVLATWAWERIIWIFIKWVHFENFLSCEYAPTSTSESQTIPEKKTYSNFSLVRTKNSSHQKVLLFFLIKQPELQTNFTAVFINLL
jgi:hypothetical protein